MPRNVEVYNVFKGTDREFKGTRKEISKHFNVNYNTLMDRINKQNMTLEEAISIKKCHNSSHLGETKLMNCGMKATIIEYFKSNNITVQFEDGTIVKNKIYNNFKKGEIANNNFNNKNIRLGKTKLMNCGMKATIIEYFGCNNITIQFEDGTIIKNKQYDSFKKGAIANLNKHVGETRMMNCGMKCTIIEYFNCRDITVQFEDGTIVKNKQYYNFKKCKINNSSLNYFTIFKGTDKEFVGTLRQISYHFNLNYESLRSKINNYNITIEEAIEIPVRRFYQNGLNYKGKKGTMRELCQKFDKNFIEVYNKVKYNHTFEWAMDSTIKSYEEE